MLTESDVKDVVDTWFHKIGVKPACPFCSSKTWKTGIACSLPASSGHDFRVIPLTCSQCAYTMLLHADTVFESMSPKKIAPSTD